MGSVLTGGTSLLAVPFYPLRCIVCGVESESPAADSLQGDGPSLSKEASANIVRWSIAILLCLFIGVVLSAVLGAIGAPDKKKELLLRQRKAVHEQMILIGKALDSFRDHHERYPSTTEGLKVLQQGKLSRDPWGILYVYNTSADMKTYELWSYGADGVVGGNEEKADLEFSPLTNSLIVHDGVMTIEMKSGT